MTDKKGIVIGDSAFPKGESLERSYQPKPQGSTQPKVEPNQNVATPPPSKDD
jgi:hypothetical protein